ncbi:amino acid adenylation domain-containing protein [Pseudoalteromonas luteoviolacea]|uniref:non-ribosomal peptide synthetase n=1 Tax=Pseudoalteromonas luteoviolacea TaxID=43657 RepID=UPI001B3A78ED|nr:non-ribosomal peptide synthetase [Pseudoalteromonas luteoviolacea]MBQ4880453.1 amino acid adenylation domain-containing protein [Pseudoalteromonas luteoviolacea]MBQ4909519.1 amino acid adenylation domain-containing protein [Pseudoalteromonas luteoviolacea]
MELLKELLQELKSKEIYLSLDVSGELSVKGKKELLSTELITLLKKHKASLVDLIKAKTTSASTAPVIKKVTGEQAIELSFSQRSLWLQDQIDGGSAHYNIPSAIKLSGTLDSDALQRAFNTILLRHESLRTCFIAADDGEPIQQLREDVDFQVALTDLSTFAQEQQDERIAEIVSAEADKPFDLARDVMLRVQLLKLAPQEHILLATMHHIASDGWSMGILVNEFSRLYTAYLQGQTNPLPPLSIQYGDYAHWQRNYLQGSVLDEQLAYWEKQLADLPVLHGLPLDYPRPAVQSFAGNVYFSRIDKATHESLMTLCQAQGATLFMGLHAAFSVLLARYSNEQDIVIGTPVANREQAEVAGLIGFFVNTLVLRCDLSGNPGFRDLLAQSNTMLLDAYAHQQVPFEQIVERLQPGRSPGHTPLFQIMIVLQNNAQSRFSMPGLSLSEVEDEGEGTAKFDLTLNINESSEGLMLSWGYSSALFNAQTIERMAGHFEVLLSSLLTSPDLNVYAHELVTPLEREQLLDSRSDSEAHAQSGKCLHELFEAQVQREPDKTALVYEGASLSYDELNRRANQLARYLQAQGVKTDTLVGLCVERSLETVIGILAILKAGGAYVPLDPANPQSRLAYMLEDSGVQTVLTSQAVLAQLPLLADKALCLDDEAVKAQLSDMPLENLTVSSLGLTCHHLAYVIYTSGSTGQPKGVLVQHNNVTRLLETSQEHFAFNEEDVWTLFHSYAFDFSVWEIWGALAHGGCLVVVPYWVSRASGDFYQLLEQEKVTVLNQTPSAFNLLIAEDGRAGSKLALRYVIFGGEALNFTKLKPWVERHGDNAPELVNMYGITETTVHVTYRRIWEQDLELCRGASLIGKPLSDLDILLLNDKQVLVPNGIGGEMYVSGQGVSRGYLNREELSAERFVCLPGQGHKRFYRTGDLARRLAGGELEYLGRIDHQVKVRGFRIELGEIEHALADHSAIREALVLAREAGENSTHLVAYLVAGESEIEIEANLLIESVKGHLRQVLPEYMVPSAFVVLESLPLTANGKVNVKALPEPDMTLSRVAYVAPQSQTELVLCAIWQQVLEIDRVGITDNFFSLGGDSMRVVQLVHAAAKVNIRFSAQDVFLHQTIGKLALHLITHGNDDNLLSAPAPLALLGKASDYLADCPKEVEDVYPVTQMQSLMIEKHIEGVENGGVYAPQQLFSFSDPGFSPEAFETSLRFLMQKHPVLRTTFSFCADSQQYLQFVYREVELPLEIFDLTSKNKDEHQAFLEEFIAEDAKCLFIFDGKSLMVRYRLFKVSNSDWKFLISTHHAIDDGWGFVSFINEMFECYEKVKAGDKLQLQHATVNVFKERVALEVEALQSKAMQEFWRDQYEQAETMPRVTVGREPLVYRSKRLSIDSTLFSKLKSFAQANNKQLKTLFLFAYYKALRGLLKQNFISIDVVTSGRSERLSDPVHALGLFWTFVPVHCDMGEEELLSALKLLQTRLIDVENNALFPLYGIRDQSAYACFNYVQFHHSKMADKNSKRSHVDVEYASDRFHHIIDLFTSVNVDGSQAFSEINYWDGLIDIREIDLLMELYIKALENLIDLA